MNGLNALDLERLFAIRPDIVIEATSEWVLVLNPATVSDFLRARPFDHNAEGSVSVGLWVSATGSVEWAEIIESSGRPEMDEIALALFREVVVFRPARLGGAAQPTSAIFIVNFPW